jgi:hypothetical protein
MHCEVHVWFPDLTEVVGQNQKGTKNEERASYWEVLTN